MKQIFYPEKTDIALLLDVTLILYSATVTRLQPHPFHLVFLCLLPSFKRWGQEVICSNPSGLSMMKLYWFLWMINIALCAAYGKPFVDGTELSLSISSCLSPYFPSFLHLSHDWLSKKSDSPQPTSASLFALFDKCLQFAANIGGDKHSLQSEGQMWF